MFREDSRYLRIKRMEIALSVLFDEIFTLQCQADSLIPDDSSDFEFAYHMLSNDDKTNFNFILSQIELLKQSSDLLQSTLADLKSSDD